MGGVLATALNSELSWVRVQLHVTITLFLNLFCPQPFGFFERCTDRAVPLLLSLTTRRRPDLWLSKTCGCIAGPFDKKPDGVVYSIT